MCVRVCVCVCVRERGRQREGERQSRRVEGECEEIHVIDLHVIDLNSESGGLKGESQVKGEG